MLYVSAYNVGRPQAGQQKNHTKGDIIKNLTLLILLYLPLYGVCIDMPEDTLSTGRNM